MLSTGRNVVIYISIDYIVRQTIIHFIIESTTNNNNLFLDNYILLEARLDFPIFTIWVQTHGASWERKMY